VMVTARFRSVSANPHIGLGLDEPALLDRRRRRGGSRADQQSKHET
jgi:hypothetical protein